MLAGGLSGNVTNVFISRVRGLCLTPRLVKLDTVLPKACITAAFLS